MIKASVIISTYNRAQYLDKTLESLSSQVVKHHSWEIVLVDNNSTDETEAVFRRFSDINKGVMTKYVFEAKQGLSCARNRGISESNGEYLIFLDDDIKADPNLVESYCNFFDANISAIACGGVVTAYYECPRPKWATWYTDRMLAGVIDLGNRITTLRKGQYPTGANFAIRRTAIDRFGTFDTQLGRTGNTPLGGEEKDFFDRFTKAGEKIWFLPDARIQHIVPAWKTGDEYFEKLTDMIGRSERTRTLNISRREYRKRLMSELIKWGGTIVLFLWHSMMLSPSRGWYLIKMRFNISRGLLGYPRKEQL